MVAKQFLIALDQTINTLVPLSDGFGYADEMLSARAWRLRNKHPKLHAWINTVFFWDGDHCAECYEIEKERKQLPSEYRA